MSKYIPSNKKVLIPAIILATIILLYLILAAWQYFYNSNKFGSGSQVINYSISGQTTSEAAESLNNSIAQKNVIIEADDVVIKKSASHLGVYINEDSLSKSLENQRLKRALLPFIYSKKVESPIEINETQFNIVTQNSIPNKNKPPKYSRYSYNNGKLDISDSATGNGVVLSQIKEQIFKELLDSGELIVKTNLQEVEPAITKTTLENLNSKATNIASNKYDLLDDKKTFSIDSKLIMPELTPNEFLTDLTITIESAQKIVEQVASQANVQAVDEVTTTYKSGKPKAITTDGEKGRKVNNIEELAYQLVDSVNSIEGFTGNLKFNETDFKKKEIVVDDTPKTATYTYKIITWGKTVSSLDDFATKVAQTLADGRGWAQAGVTFKRVTGASDFDVVLSEPAELPARYPGTCDSTYSCRVGRYVIINDDRWRLATPSWNNANGTLRDYQHMVVNHEIGHRLGRGHEYCSAPGSAAPVMQQQSISLQGCKFNPWPLAYEIAAVQRSL